MKGQGIIYLKVKSGKKKMKKDFFSFIFIF